MLNKKLLRRLEVNFGRYQSETVSYVLNKMMVPEDVRHVLLMKRFHLRFKIITVWFRFLS